jgi:hypothetical protein
MPAALRRLGRLVVGFEPELTWCCTIAPLRDVLSAVVGGFESMPFFEAMIASACTRQPRSGRPLRCVHGRSRKVVRD